MKQFAQNELRAAYAHAAAGGQALHVCDARQFVTAAAPACFRRAREFAHLIDANRARLEATARKLGVRVVKVERPGRVGQHVDLVGKPLERAKAVATTVAEIQQALAGGPWTL